MPWLVWLGFSLEFQRHGCDFPARFLGFQPTRREHCIVRVDIRANQITATRRKLRRTRAQAGNVRRFDLRRYGVRRHCGDCGSKRRCQSCAVRARPARRRNGLSTRRSASGGFLSYPVKPYEIPFRALLPRQHDVTTFYPIQQRIAVR